MKHTILLLSLLCLLGCVNSTDAPSASSTPSANNLNPPAPGFNKADSDSKAIAIADEVMEAMGGRANWDAARYFRWNLSGLRTLFWDKKEERLRIDFHKNSSSVILNMVTMEGKLRKDGLPITDPEELNKNLETALKVWELDVSWLAMPFMMKNKGRTLKYLGESQTEDGANADWLLLTVEKENRRKKKYHVWVGKESRLVEQWAEFQNADSERIIYTAPWRKYKKIEGILLAIDRGERYQVTELKVFKELPEYVFTTLDVIPGNL